MSQISILVVDDHPIVRQGIRSLLSNYPEFEIVGEADNGESALSGVKEMSPDITLLDIRMPGESGLDILKEIRHIQANAKVLMLTSFDEEEYVMDALKAGARGFILKGVSDEILVNAIRAVHRGERVLSPQVTEQVVQRLIAKPPDPVEEDEELEFDDDEQQILRMLVAGDSNSQISSQLYISSTTVKRKLRKIFAKLNVQTRAQAAAEAVRRGLV